MQRVCARKSPTPPPPPPQAAIDEDIVNQVQAAILEDRGITVRKVADRVNISVGSVEKIIKEHLHMRKNISEVGSPFLTPFPEEVRVNSSRELLAMCHSNQEDFFARLITQDETWVHRFDTETKMQSKQWKHQDSPNYSWH